MKLTIEQEKELKRLDNLIRQFEPTSSTAPFSASEVISFFNFNFPDAGELENQDNTKRSSSRQEVFLKSKLSESSKKQI